MFDVGRYIELSNGPAIDEQAEENIDNIMNNAISQSLGSIYADKSFENYKDSAGVVDKIKSAIDENKSVYIFGKSRKGKTHLASGIFRYIRATMKRGVKAWKCVNLDMLISNYGNESRQSIIERTKVVPYLILDDIGVGKLTPERHSIYYYIIDYRISNNLCTIYTSNYKTVGLWQAGTDIEPTRIITRIQESCIGIELE